MNLKTLVALGALAATGACANRTQVEAGGEVAPAIPMTADYLPPGTTMQARLDRSLGTSVSHEGDQFTATVTSPVMAQNGAVAVPAGATIYGHVSGLHHSSIPTQESVIRLAFDRIAFNGSTYPLNASVSNVSVQNQPANATTSSVTKGAVTGAAAGAVLGAVISGGELSRILEGGLLGAAAGSVVSLGTGTTEPVIPAGSLMTVRSNQGVQIR